MSIVDTAPEGAVAEGYFECSLCGGTAHNTRGVLVSRGFVDIDWSSLHLSESDYYFSTQLARRVVLDTDEFGREIIGSDRYENSGEYLARVSGDGASKWTIRAEALVDRRDVMVCANCNDEIEPCFVNDDDCVVRIPTSDGTVYSEWLDLSPEAQSEFISRQLVENYANRSTLSMRWRVAVSNTSDLMALYFKHLAWAENGFRGTPLDYALNPFGGAVSVEVFADLLALRSLDLSVFKREMRFTLSRYAYSPDNSNGCSEHTDWVECARCDTAYHEDDVCWVTGPYDGESWCANCRDAAAEYCESCEEYEMGSACSGGSSSEGVHSYSWSPNPLQFWRVDGDGDLVATPISGGRDVVAPASSLYMGFELEMEMKGNCGPGDVADHLLELWPDESIYFKTDSSLNYGVEMVSHPMTLEAFKRMPLDSLATLAEMGVRSWNTSTCGMHIHLSRRAFKGNTHIWAFSHLLAQNVEQMVAIAGRNSERFGRLDTEFMAEGLRNHLKGEYSARYSAINYQNRFTLELRMFKGTLRYERVLANLEFAHAAHAYTAKLSANSIIGGAKSMKEAAKSGALGWAKFAEFIQSNADLYQNLITILTEKSLLTVENGAN